MCKRPCKGLGDLIIDSVMYVSGPSQKTPEWYQESAQTAQTDAPITSSKRRRLYIADSQASSAQVDQDPEEEVRRELGLDTNNLIEGSDGEEGEVLELDDGYRY